VFSSIEDIIDFYSKRSAQRKAAYPGNLKMIQPMKGMTVHHCESKSQKPLGKFW